MFLRFDNESIRLSGRWDRRGETAWYKKIESAATTTTGSTIEFAFTGKMAVMHFDVEWNEHPYPHLWISVDNGAKVEVPLDNFIRVEAETYGLHTVKVIYKSCVEMQHRWNEPLIGKIAFCGIEVDKGATLYEDNRKTIEFVGDSITEGVLIDANYNPHSNDQHNRVYQDDVTATYAYLTAQNLNLHPVFMGYGATGLTHGGCGSVPRAIEAYPYCYHNAPNTCRADYIVINHGANDQRSSAEEYIKDYEAFLTSVRNLNPTAQIIVLSPFCGAFADELESFVPEYNLKYNDKIFFINSKGWVPSEPIHPLRDGHKIIAEHLTERLRKLLNLD